MSVGFGFSLPALAQYGGGGNNPFGQLGPTLDLSFAGTVTDTGDPNGYTLNTNFIAPQYQVAADYTIWETNVGLVSKAFGDIITFTRASSATFVGSNGLIQSATTNTPRFDYDPVTLAAKGLLIEEQRTNLLTYSEDFTNAAWVKVAASVTANSAVSPDGASTADKIVEDTSTNVHGVRQDVATSAVAYGFSVYAKPDGRNWFYLYNTTTNAYVYFNISSGVVGTSSSATGLISSAGNGWYKCTIVTTATAATNAWRVYLASDNNVGAYTGDGTSGIFIWGAQLEAGSFATSYIPTVASQVTRSADVALVNTLSPWYNATEGTVYVETSPIAVDNDIGFSISDSSGYANSIYVTIDSNDQFNVVSSSVVQARIDAGTITTNAVNKISSAYKANDFASSVNGGAAVTDISGVIPTVDRAVIGGLTNNTANRLNGHIRRITYYPRRLSNAELQAITA